MVFVMRLKNSCEYYVIHYTKNVYRNFKEKKKAVNYLFYILPSSLYSYIT
jgi:hypothetical protein